jgi:molybdate transport system substrate-binding protein
MLAAQIEQGLPADVFASANTGLPWQLRRKGLVTRPVVFTSNKLVIVIAPGNPLHLHNVHDLERSGLKIVMAAAGVPVGDYTRKVLKRLGLSDLVDKAVSQRRTCARFSRRSCSGSRRGLRLRDRREDREGQGRGDRAPESRRSPASSTRQRR